MEDREMKGLNMEVSLSGADMVFISLFFRYVCVVWRVRAYVRLQVCVCVCE